MSPRILTFDVETFPALVYTFSLWSKYTPIEAIKEPDYMACFAAKWLGETGVQFYRHDQHDLGLALFNLLDEADVVVTWNGDKFDIPWANRVIKESVGTPPSPFVSVDLIKTQKRIKHLSMKLDYASETSFKQRKLKHEGLGLWLKCMAGDPKAWAKFERYNKRDVVLTEKHFVDLRPWINNFPSLVAFEDDAGERLCPRCLKNALVRRGDFTTKAGLVYQRYCCKSCGGWTKAKRSHSNVTVKPA